MEDLGLVGDLAVVAIAAIVGGAIMRALGLPTLLGYLIAGVAIGPHTPGFVGDVDQTRTIADLGVALLMFTLGIRFSVRELLEMREIALIGGLGQVASIVCAGALLGLAIGVDWKEAVVLGMVASISSTMVALRLLEQRGQIGSPAGRLGVTFALTQDIAVVILLFLLPVIAGGERSFFEDLVLSLGKACLFLLVAGALGPILVPRLLNVVALTRSRELFILAIVALALGTASVSALAGLSLAFGAFLAGLMVSESDYAHQTLAQVLPLREIFAVVFFVAVGMLIDPGAATDRPEIVAAIIATGVVFKAFVIAGLSRAFAYSSAASTTAALALANTGEFSFIITEAAEEEGIIDPKLNASLLAAVFLSLALSTPLTWPYRQLVPLVARFPSKLSPALAGSGTHEPDLGSLKGHVVIGGYGQGARELTSVLDGRNFGYLVIDDDPLVVQRLRGRGIRCILGDPSLAVVLGQASIERARVLAVTLADIGQVEEVVREARALNSRLDIIVRSGDERSRFRLLELGASAVVQPELELGLEFVRHTLRQFGVSSQEIQVMTAGRRRRYP